MFGWLKKQAKKILKKAEEEIKQFEELGFAGYVVQNGTTLLAHAVDCLGFDGLANSMRNKRNGYVEDAQQAQKTLEKRFE